MSAMVDKFCYRLYEAMEERGKSVRQVSEETGIAYNTLVSYRNGERNPTMKTIRALCWCLDVSSDWLIGLRDEVEW